MSEVRLLLRVCILLCAALLIGTCRSADDKTILTGVCSSMLGDANPDGPTVCVDDGPKMPKVSHNTITMNRTRPGVGATEIQWLTRSGTGPLEIDVQPGCFTHVSCAAGRCSAKALPVTARKTCKYSVFINDGNHEKLDPDVVVVPCCP